MLGGHSSFNKIVRNKMIVCFSVLKNDPEGSCLWENLFRGLSNFGKKIFNINEKYSDTYKYSGKYSYTSQLPRRPMF